MKRCYPAIGLLAASLILMSTVGPSAGAERVFATPGPDEVLVLESENLQAFVRLSKKGDWCRGKANLNLYIRDDAVFAADRRELKTLLADLPGVLRAECSKLRSLGIRGFIAGKRIYRATITAMNATPKTTESLNPRIAKKYSAPVTPNTKVDSDDRTLPDRQNKPGSPDTTPETPREETGRLFSAARHLGEQCDMLAAWTKRFFDEYPDFNVLGSNIGEFEPRAANLFGDQLFVPLFGRPYDETGPAWREQVFEQVYRRCPKKYRFTPGVGAVFRGGFGSYAARLNRETLLVKVKERRKIRAWLDSQHSELDSIPASVAGLERLHALATDGAARISALWPSEQTAFTSMVVSRRSQVALSLADERITALPVEGESLRLIVTILGDTEPYVVASDNATLAALREQAERRRKEIRAGLVEREMAALAGYPDELLSLAQISAQAQWLLETVGRTPPLPVLERYELAWADRCVEIARAALPSFKADLARLPATFSGASAAISNFQSISGLLASLAPAWVPIYEKAAIERTSQIYDALIDAAVARVSKAADRSRDEGWRVALRLPKIGADEAAAFADTPAKDGAAETISSAALREANGVAEKEFGRFRDEVSNLQVTWGSVDELDRVAALVRQHEQTIPSLRSYAEKTVARRADVLDSLAEKARVEIQATGASHLDVDEVLTLGEQNARRFDEAGASAAATVLRKIAVTRAAAIVDTYFPTFEEDLTRLEASRTNAAELELMARDFEMQANRLRGFVKYREAALARAAAIRETFCERAVERAGLAPADEKLGILGADEPMTLRKFVCALDDKGHAVSEFAAHGTVNGNGVYTLKVFQSDGQFVFATLKSLEILPGQHHLVGTALGDAALQEPISVNRWRVYAAQLLDVAVPHDVAADGAGVTGPGFGSGRSMSSKQVFDRLRRSAVLLYFVGRGKNGQLIPKHVGTGFFISPRDIMTNAHVAEAYEGYVGTWYAINETVGVHRVTVVKNARKNTPLNIDAAVMQTVDAESSHHLRFSIDMFRDEWIAIGGYPGAAAEFDQRYDILETALKRGHTPRLDELPTALVDQGRLSNIIVQRETKATDLQYTMETAGGSSGSAVVNACGEVVGLHYSGSLSKVRDDDTVAASKYNMAVSSKDVQIFLQLIGVKSDTASKACGIDG